jgi:type II secretory pathway component PulJ
MSGNIDICRRDNAAARFGKGRARGHARHADGFTMIEMLVAITMTIIIAGSAMYTFTLLERHRRVQERRTRHAAEAQAFFSLLARELGGLYRYGGENGYKTFEVADPDPYDSFGSRLTFTTAIEPLPGADHAQVTYYVDASGLHREIVSPGYTPPGGSTVFAPDVRRLDVVTDPDPVPAGALPKRLLVTIALPHHDQWQEASMNVTWSHFFKVENNAP